MCHFIYEDSLYVVERTTTQEQAKFKAEMRSFLVALSKKSSSNRSDIGLFITADAPAVVVTDCYEHSHPSLNYATVNIHSKFVGLNLLIQMGVLLRSGYHDYLNIDFSEQLTINEVEFSRKQDVDYVIDFFANDSMSEDVVDEELLISNKQALGKLISDMRMLSTEVFDHIGNSLGNRYLKTVEDSNGDFPYIKTDIQVSDAEILILKQQG